jgi:hypothetical protein
MKKGLSIVEAILAIFIILIVVTSTTTAILGGLSMNRLASEQSKATYLASEGLEATKSIRDRGWNFIVSGTYGLSPSGNIWNFSGTSDIDTTNRFTRKIEIFPIKRDSSFNILPIGTGSLDPYTFEINSTVTWNFNSTRQNSVILTTYLTNWALGKGKNLPTCSDYCHILNYTNGGTCRSDSVTCSSNGETAENKANYLCPVPGPGTCCCKP